MTLNKIIVFFMASSIIALSIFYAIRAKNTDGELPLETVSVVEQAQQSVENAKKYQDLKNQLAQVLNDPHVFFAPVNKAFVRKLADLPKKDETLFVRSIGGDVHDGYIAGRIIHEEGHSIVVSEYCDSACAEFLLPAADKVIFNDSPLIGFHGNSLSRESLIKEQAGDDAILCHSATGLNTRIRRLYKETGHNPDFWRDQYDHLIVTSKTVKVQPFTIKQQFKEVVIDGKKFSDITECYSIDIKTKHSFWHPTSEQLKNGFGLKFEGGVCADDKNCYEGKIDQFYPKGTSFAVGDVVYISKGPPQ